MVCWPGKTWPRWILAGLAACLLLFPDVDFPGYLANAAEIPGMVHITQAEILRTPSAILATNTTVDETSLQGHWTTTSLPFVLHRPGGPHAGPETVWVRVPVGAFADRQGPVDLFLTRWIGCGQLSIYGDGHLLYRSTGSPLWNLNSRPWALVHLSTGDDDRPPRTVLLRLDWQAGQSAAISSMYVGAPGPVGDEAKQFDLLAKQIPFMISVSFVLIGLFGFFLWLREKDFPGHLIFAIALLGMLWRWHFYMGAEHPQIRDDWYVWLTINAALWQVAAQHYLLRSLHGARQVWRNRGLLTIIVLLSIISLPLRHPSLSAMAQWDIGAYLIIVPLLICVASNGAWQAWRRRSVNAGLLAGAMLISEAAAIMDLYRLIRLDHMEGLYLTTYLLRLVSLVCVYLLFSHYMRAAREIRIANVTLEQRVQEREAELSLNYERLREIERRQVLSEERQRLMQDMHDGLGSSLNSALRVAESRQGDIELSDVIRKCIDDLKLTVDSLEPVDGDLLLLLATLRYRFGCRLERAGIDLSWEVGDLPTLDWLNPCASLHILRILQEALANVLQHTRATEIRVATGNDERSVWVSMTDNGPGFDVSTAIRKGGRGLTNQLRRATSIGGKIDWHSSGSGTQLTLFLPRETATDRPVRATSAAITVLSGQ